MDFQRKKDYILQKLSVPLSEYEDLSPKGTVDVEIRDLMDEINAHAGLVTTSSCAGRISVFLEGVKTPVIKETNGESVSKIPASAGGKGGGGRWLYISHKTIPCHSEEGTASSQTYTQIFGLSPIAREVETHKSRYVHFKFEAMVTKPLAS